MATVQASYYDCQWDGQSKSFNGSFVKSIEFPAGNLTDLQIVRRAKKQLGLTGVRLRKISEDLYDVPNSMMRLEINVVF